MPERIHAHPVGAPDPAKRTSTIVEETDEAFEAVTQELSENLVCYFNDKAYDDREYICSGDELLRCENGAWIRMGSCDPDNP